MARWVGSFGAVLVGLAACSSGGVPPAIAAGSGYGGDAADRTFTWELHQSTVNTRGVELRVPGPRFRSSSSAVYADGPDDAVWVGVDHPAVDAAQLAFGGIRSDVDGARLQLGDGTEIEMTVYAVEGKSWRAVMAELPFGWEQTGGFQVVAVIDGAEVAREGMWITG